MSSYSGAHTAVRHGGWRIAATLLVALIGAWIGVAAAQNDDSGPVIAFTISRGSLVGAIKQFAEQTGIQVTADFGRPEVQEHPVAEINQSLTPRAALDRILDGSGLSAMWYSPRTIRIYPGIAPPPVPQIGPDDPVDWDMPRLSIEDAATHFKNRLSVQVVYDVYDKDMLVGPIRAQMTPRELWTQIMDEVCADVVIGPRGLAYTASPRPIPGLNDIKTHYELPAAPLVDMVHRLSEASPGLPLSIAPAMHSQLTVGPIEGYMTMEDALLKILAQIPAPGYTYVYLDSPSEIALIWKDIDRPLQDLTQDAARLQLCLARIPPKSGSMLVVATQLPSLGNDIAARPVVLDRHRIEEIGASSIPELLQHVSQSSFTRTSGYRLNGAQYAEGRGVGPAMVLIENKRTIASANSLTDTAFDLNTIPLSAVERIEVLADSGSIVYGIDSLGGIVNIVLRRPVDELGAELRYGGSRGGSIEMRATALARTPSESFDATLIADYLEVTNLLGGTRSRFANQDYRRYGGPDRRSLSSAPGNLRSANGRNLPGFNTPIVGLPSGIGADVSELSAQPNLTSLLQYQSIAPARTRASLVGTGKMALGRARISGDTIYTRQTTQYSLAPPAVQGALIARNHPQNPFGLPLLYYGLLTGLPAQPYESKSELLRGSAALSGPVLGWDWEVSLVGTRESFDAALNSMLDPLSLSAALNTDRADVALDILAPATGDARLDLLAPRIKERHTAKASQVHLVGDRAFRLLGDRNLSARFGADWRDESIDLADVDDAAQRTVTSGFLSLRMPVVRSLAASAGARIDRYSGGESVTSGQYGISWNASDVLDVYADFGERYRPPSLYELYSLPMSVQIPVSDPKTNQTTVVTLVSGGRLGLKPTTATAARLGFTLKLPAGWKTSLDYWQVSAQDRIYTLPLLLTLANEDYLPGRVTRGPSETEGMPGVIQKIDIGWQNLGELRASGFDLDVKGRIPLASGALVPRLGVTLNTKYAFRDLPPEVGPLVDRVGVASEHGTIPRYRAVGSLTWENDEWNVTTNLRHHARYRDSNPGAVPLRSYVSSQTIVDVNAARRLGKTTTLTLGASNLFDSEPDYSAISSWGYDTSQGDMRGRFIFGELRMEF